MPTTPSRYIDYRLVFALMNGKVSSALRRRLNADFLAAGISINGDQWDVLIAASSAEVCTQQSLCEATSFSKATMTRIINSLENMGLLVRRKARVDYRNNYITLTLNGIHLVNRAQAVAIRTLTESLRGLSRIDISISQQSLKTVLENLHEKEQQVQIEQHQEQHQAAQAHRRAVRKMHDGAQKAEK